MTITDQWILEVGLGKGTEEPFWVHGIIPDLDYGGDFIGVYNCQNSFVLDVVYHK